MRECDGCGEICQTQEVDMFFHIEHWCQECLDKAADREPDYDVESADEKYQRDWQEHQKLHS